MQPGRRPRPVREAFSVLLPLLVTLVLTALGIAIVAKVTQHAIRRLGLDLFDTLEWLGLAEDPVSHSSFTFRRLRMVESIEWGELSGAPKRGA
jgi:hypothetical protein